MKIAQIRPPTSTPQGGRGSPGCPTTGGQEQLSSKMCRPTTLPRGGRARDLEHICPRFQVPYPPGEGMMVWPFPSPGEGSAPGVLFLRMSQAICSNHAPEAIHTDVVNEIFYEYLRQFAHFGDQGLSTKSSRAAGLEEEGCMSRFVLISIFLCFLKGNCPNWATHLHTTGGAGHQAAQPGGQSSN